MVSTTIRSHATLLTSASRCVPRPKNEVFRITKTNHNILQGVSEPDERLSADQTEMIKNWIHSTAKREWVRKRGPLAKVEDGGAHILFVDDPQMPDVVPLAKEIEPNRPVLYRSHIQVRADLVDGAPDSPTAEVFDWLYLRIKEADLFIAHPVRDFVPKLVEPQKVAYLPATTGKALCISTSNFDGEGRLKGARLTQQLQTGWTVSTKNSASKTLATISTSTMPTVSNPPNLNSPSRLATTLSKSLASTPAKASTPSSAHTANCAENTTKTHQYTKHPNSASPATAASMTPMHQPCSTKPWT